MKSARADTRKAIVALQPSSQGSPPGSSLTSRGRLLRDAFLASNLMAMLTRASLGEMHESDRALMAEGVEFLEKMDRAWRYLYTSDNRLMPSSDELDTVTHLRAHGYKDVPSTAAHVKDVLTSVIEATESGTTPDPEEVLVAQSFIRTIHESILHELWDLDDTDFREYAVEEAPFEP